jgi:hypothetical protein
MIDFDRIRAIKSAARQRLFAIPGVHAVGIGRKFVDGKRTEEISIAVFVLEKKPAANLPPEHVIPPEIDGVKTDVIEQRPPRLLNSDNNPYRPVLGGIRIQPGGALGGGGTLGCIARTNDAQPKIVGITCHHVVADPKLLPTNVTLTSHGVLTVAVAGATATPGTLIVVEFPSTPARGAYFTTGSTDTADSIAIGIADAVNALSLAGISATPSGADVTITSPDRFDVHRYGPNKADDDAKLKVAVSNPAITTHVIAFFGRCKNGYGIYTRINPGGAQPTIGRFTAVDEHFALSGAASAVASSLQAVVTELGITGITISSPIGTTTVTITGAESVICDVTSDTRVGQPDNRFGCSTSWCTNNRIGRVIDSRADVDAALIQLDGGLTYLAQIQEYGVVPGFYEVTDSDVHSTPHKEYPVKKRGEATGKTEGTILFLHMDGFIPLDDTHSFGAQYREGMQIVSGVDEFAAPGDSGSALLSADAANDGKVVGIIFGAGLTIIASGFAMAMPIQVVTAALKVTLETATEAQKNVPRPVPKAAHAMAMLPDDEMEGTSMAGRPSAALRDRLWEAGNEISATPVGRAYADALRRHIPETQDLINTNRRVGAVWRRNGGTEIVQGFIEMVQSPGRTLPATINDRPVTDCVRRIQKALARYGSAGLVADLIRFGPRLAQSCSLTYPQILAALQADGGE